MFYFDASKGDLDEILVSVGDKVSEGQALVKYSSSEAQAAYDSASRAVAKADRHINELNQARNEAASAPAPQLPTPAGGEGAAAQVSGNAVSSIDAQLGDARDARADAAAQLSKAQNQLDAMTVLSTLEGTVVEVNHNVSKSPTGASQVVVHVVSNENLQVKGELSEYNLANLSVGQEVTFTSKVTKIRVGQVRLAISLTILKLMAKQQVQLLPQQVVILVLNIHIPSMLQVKSVI